MSALEKIMELAPKAVEEAERILNRSASMNAFPKGDFRSVRCVSTTN